MLEDQEKYLALFRKSIEAFHPVSDTSFAKFIELVRLKTFTKGEQILMKGQTAKKIYFICEGILISQWIDELGNVHIKNFFLEGAFAGSKVSLLQETKSEFSIEAVTDGVIIEMDYSKYKKMIYENDDLKNFYIHYLEQKWVIENEKRQISFAAQNATERYLSFLQNYPDLQNRVPQRLIALYLGITPTQLSRIRKSI
ncbi:Crp/Fnr family transcriptional regulator [Chondrinema litorale]|uniref:Crp/Fnr family transcriptional regulator n=1 Tax=Chondrinema litorale TaxID=2994555 RepID=UPI0025438EB2|nr:Crp/Fnr family transcriptional regulator [Chondrinema litorale]UZR97929.1 Crp/Fnr family transcriptional regulator [Chondrinema litorale]